MKTTLQTKGIKKVIFSFMLFIGLMNSYAQCPATVLTLLTQADVDNFAITYAGITDWDGSINIGEYEPSTNITNLNGLSNLESICGTLLIYNNPLLPNLQGLENLTSIGSDLQISVNPLLTNLQGLNNLVSVEGIFSIQYNHGLINLQGLENLNSTSSLYFFENNVLTNLSGLGSLNITNTLSIAYNPVFQNISDLNLLNSHLENLYIVVNPMLQNIDALQTITTAGFIEIAANNALNSLTGLSNLVSANHLVIAESPLITNVDFLQNSTNFGRFSLQYMNVTNLSGLVNVISIDDLFLLACSQLENLAGLENLDTLKRFDISENPLLNSISALSNVIIPDYNPITDLVQPYIYFYENPLLSQCSIDAICEQITNPDFDVEFISGNGIGCESAAAIEAVCATLDVPEINAPTVKIFPTLTSGLVTISGGDFVKVKIYDITGRNVFDAMIEASSFNVETLSSGRYFVQLLDKNGVGVFQDLLVK